MSRKIEVQIVGDSRSLHRALGTATEGTSRLSHSFRRAAEFAAGFGLALGAERVFEFGKEAISAAAQTQKATESIRENFGKAGEEVVKFNENAAAGFGISAQSAAQFATQIGLMTTNIGLSKKQGAEMTIGLEKLAGSVALIKGQDPAAAFGKLNKALLGNTRGLKDMGIAITPVDEKLEAMRRGFIGPDGTISSLTSAQKAQVIYGLAVRKLPTLLDQARKHSGDLADQILVLRARLSNFADEMGAKVLPLISSLVGSISKIAAAPNFSIGVKVAFKGVAAAASDLAAGIQHALLGSTKTIKIKAPSGLVIGNKTETSKGIVQSIAAGLASANWTAVGAEVGAGISSSIKFTASAVGNLVSGLIAALSAHSGDLAALGVQIVAKMFVDILDPSFWIKNWRLALDVAVAALTVAFIPAKFLAPLRALPFADVLIKPLLAIGKPLRVIAETLGRGIASGIRDVFPETLGAARELGGHIVGPLRSLPGRALRIIESMGRFIGQELANTARVSFREAIRIGSRIVDGLDNFIGRVGAVASRMVSRFVSALSPLAGRVVGPIARAGRTILRAIGGFIGAVSSKGYAIGRAIMEGIASGLSSLVGWLEGKIASIAGGLLDKAKGILHISSPSKRFADEVGRPIAEGIALGITRHSDSVTSALAGAVGGGRGVGNLTAAASGGVMQVNLILDRRVLSSVLVDLDKDYRRQNSGRELLSGGRR